MLCDGELRTEHFSVASIIGWLLTDGAIGVETGHVPGRAWRLLSAQHHTRFIFNSIPPKGLQGLAHPESVRSTEATGEISRPQPRPQLLTVETFTRSGLAPSQSGQALSLGLSPGPGAPSSRRSCPCFRAPTEPSRGRGALSLRLTALAQSNRETVNPRPSEHRHTTFLNYILCISIPVLSSADMALDRMSVLPQTGYIQLGRCNNVSILMFPTGVCFHSVGTVGQ